MLSSSFGDLQEHRQALLGALKVAELMPVNMEDRPQQPSTNTLESSIHMVDEADGFIGIVSNRYGSIVEDALLNPDGYSLTEVEYRRALDRKLPMSMFVMSGDHPVKQADVELDPAGREKLAAWKLHVSEHFTYSGFDSVNALQERIHRDVAALREALERLDSSRPDDNGAPRDPLQSDHAQVGHPRPPELWAVPLFTPGHEFVGRRRELQLLDDWALDQENPLLLFEAIGGMGKSMLTWQWAKQHARQTRPDLAGVFWYSFYERGGDMTDFARHALAYITDRPVEDFRGRRRAALADELIPLLGQEPWLLVLDGLERILVAYHRIDKAQIRDDQVETEADSAEAQGDQGKTYSHRDCIRDADTDLLQQLTQAGPSKILITSRLTPTALLNSTGLPRPGVQHDTLTGLDPVDAERILRQAGIEGDAARMRNYLRRHFDCHPLVVGVVAGLVRNYRKAPGDFEKWADDPKAGAEPHLAEWDVVRKKNHILKVAFDDLAEEPRTLLGRLALIREACDDQTLEALNPFMPDRPTAVSEPSDLERDGGVDSARRRMETRLRRAESEQAQATAPAAIDAHEATRRRHYAEAKQQYEVYLEELRAWETSKAVQMAGQRLDDTRTDLEQRGLLQWDRYYNTYDLHPVVRGYALDSLADTDRAEAGERVADHFSSRSDPPYEQAEALSDLRNGLQTYEALVRTGQFDRAFDIYHGGLSYALFSNLDQPHVVLELLRPLFTAGLGRPPTLTNKRDQSYALSAIAIASGRVGHKESAETAHTMAIGIDLEEEDARNLRIGLSNLATFLRRHGSRVAFAARAAELALRLARHLDEDNLARALLGQSYSHAFRGAFDEADAVWAEFEKLPRPANRAIYRAGMAESYRARRFFDEGRLDEADPIVDEGIRLAVEGHNRDVNQDLHDLRGRIRVMQERWAEAIEALEESSRMLRESGLAAGHVQAGIALAQARSGDHETARRTLASSQGNATSLDLAELYIALGDHGRAREHALLGYKWAWADGPPYARHLDLQRAKAVYAGLGDPEPELPPHDPDKVGKIPHEDAIFAFIEKLDRKKAERENGEDAQQSKGDGSAR